MGNHASIGGEGNQQCTAPSSDHLLRRNMRMKTRDERLPSLMRPLRSLSLEPRSVEGARVWQAGAKKSPTAHRRSPGRLEGVSKLWNPDDIHLKMIREQLQNPATHLPATSGDFLELQRFRVRKNGCQQLSDEDGQRLEELQHTITGLTTYQSSLLKRIWERASEREVAECGRAIFSHLLRSSNTPIHHFFNLVDMTDKEILNSEIFAQQSLNFATVLDFVITNIDGGLEKVCRALQSLGERHLQLSFPIDTSHWALFMRVFEDNPPRLIFQNPEGHTVWKLMVDFILRQMQTGYGVEEAKLVVGGEHRRSSTIRLTANSRSNSVSRDETPKIQRYPKLCRSSKRNQTTEG